MSAAVPPMPSGICCPSCQTPMAVHSFRRQTVGEVTLDICFSCQGIWFDEFESAQIAPSGVLDLFRLLHEQRAEPPQPWRETLRCPRCRDRLLQCLDSTRTGRFAYSRCPQRHGRYSAFSAFMIEKGFVRQLNGSEIAELAGKVQNIRCSGCGASVDIRRDQICGHCRSPIVVLDPNAVREALGAFSEKARQQQQVDPDAVADALLANERAKSQRIRPRQNDVPDVDLADLVIDGIQFIGDLLRR